MTKKEIIKQELAGIIQVLDGKYDVVGSQQPSFVSRNITIVDLDKLAEFLAKYVEVKLEDLVN